MGPGFEYPIPANDYFCLQRHPMKFILPALFPLLTASGASAQKEAGPRKETPAKGYEIRIQFRNSKDTAAYLVKYLFDKQYIVDTCKKVKDGNILFKGKTPLDKGMYMLVSQDKGRYFDFFIDEEQSFGLSADKDDLVKTLKATNSPQNTDLFDYLRYITFKSKEFAELKDKVKGMSAKDSAAFMAGKSREMTQTMKAYEAGVVAAHKGRFLADFINLKTEKEAPEIPKASNGRPDSLYAYTYYKTHYWDGVNFADDRILRTPFFADKFKRYFNSIVVQQADSVNKEIDIAMKQTVTGSDLHTYLLAYLLPTYEQTKVMSLLDKVFVHLVDRYVKTGQSDKIYDKKTIDIINKRADILRHLLIGSRIAELYAIDTTAHHQTAKMGFDTVKTSEGATTLYNRHVNDLSRLYTTISNVKADYLMVIFWDVDCGHCQEEIPKLLDTYHEIRKEGYDLQVLAVYAKHDYDKWHKYILDHKLDWVNAYDGVFVNNLEKTFDVSTFPVMYVLDKNKTIKAKKVGHEQLKDIVKMMEAEYKSTAGIAN